MTESKFVATCWTSAGDVAPLRDPEFSPHKAFERLEAIAATGYVGFGMTANDLRVADAEVGLDAVFEKAQQLGLTHIEVELATGWWHEESVWLDNWQFLKHAAQKLNAKMIKIGTEFGEPLKDFTHMVKPFRRLAEEAAEIGTKVALEPLPFSLIGSMPQGADLVAAVDHKAAGLMVDYWHIFRAGTSLEEMKSRVPVEYIFGIELNDALNKIEGTLFEDTRDNRKLLGEGDQDVIGFVKSIHEMGYRGDWGVEILSEEHRAKPILQGLQDAIDSARKIFAEAGI
jgi:sugar phosphate isomerase/epimerase